MSILIVEDEISLVNALKRGLTEYGYEVTAATNGQTGLQMALNQVFELIILDVMLPGLDGIQICKQIREANKLTPILMLTALDSTENIVNALDNGADDYLVKPFKMPELAARLRTLIRRSGLIKPELNQNIYTIENISIDLEAKVVSCEGIAINLTPTEYRLMEYFVKNKRKVLSRIQILDQVWDIDFNLGTNVVDVYVNYLRKKIEKSSGKKVIHTVFGMGYMMKEE
ncbi:DNA-binding response regulator [Pedobacter psychrophilus]|uniref:DNA-binding response regulator n=1 Tax=Pedobacter psychrophilus TaxID=1826909 RepID=A0A179DDU7_9SPHI|nr:response regulator transcription factor [Pedobacter psychrophilus]OAQ39201.1 DNA-binding response regulator [Pedobacter psychrophilus]